LRRASSNGAGAKGGSALPLSRGVEATAALSQRPSSTAFTRDGSSHATRYLVLYTFPRRDEEGDDVRLGVSVSRKVGNAVDRNK